MVVADHKAADEPSGKATGEPDEHTFREAGPDRGTEPADEGADEPNDDAGSPACCWRQASARLWMTRRREDPADATTDATD